MQDIDLSLKTGNPFKITCTDTHGTELFTFEALNDFDERTRSILAAGGLSAYTRGGGQ